MYKSHALLKYSLYFEKSLVKKDAYFLGCTVAVQTVIVVVEIYILTNKQTNKQTYTLAFIRSSHIQNLASSRH